MSAPNADPTRYLGDDWRTLIDVGRLAAWMDTQALGQGPIEDARLLSGGTQNLLLRFRRAGREYVLRRPPRSPRGDGDATMRREARMLAGLADSDVPHPRLIAACPDAAVLGAAFYLMAPIDGFNAATGLPEPHRSDPRLRHRMGLAMVDGIAALGTVDHAARGLSDLGRVDGYLERQVGRWRALLDEYRRYDGWPGQDGLPGVDEVGRWLDAHRPSAFVPGILHGDYHIANVMFRPDSGELAAIVDWELTTIGDPLLDLGWMLATWPDEQGRRTVDHVVEPWQGFPTAAELVERYAQGSPRDLSRIDWYAVLACYKLALIVEGTHARACAGLATAAAGERLHKAARALLERAIAWIEAGGPSAHR